MPTGIFCLGLRDWQFIVFFLVAAYTLLLVPSYLVFKEDPIYLFNCDRIDELKAIFAEVAEANGATPSELGEAVEMVEGLQGQLEVNN